MHHHRDTTGICVWLTGLSASGKTSIARALGVQLRERGRQVVALDGDVLRAGLSRDLGFSPGDRQENVRRAGEVARLMVEAGLVVTCALISPYRRDRHMVREMFDAGHFVECWVRCPLEVCERRDPKGLYARARAGELREFTGIDAPYEAPRQAEIVLETAPEEVEAAACAATIVAFLEAANRLS